MKMIMQKPLERKKIGLGLKVVLQMMEVKEVKMRMKRWKMKKEKMKKNQIKLCKTQAKRYQVILHLKKRIAILGIYSEIVMMKIMKR